MNDENHIIIIKFFLPLNEITEDIEIGIYGSYIDSPIGKMLCLSSESGIVLLEFVDQKGFEKTLVKLSNLYMKPWLWQENVHILQLKKELAEYFSGRRAKFDVPYTFTGTKFQNEVWGLLTTISYGETWSYKKQAERLGNLKAVRAVANSNSKNPIAIIVPCHRVIGSNGKLTGYAGGVWRKEYLLNLEKENSKHIILE